MNEHVPRLSPVGALLRGCCVPLALYRHTNRRHRPSICNAWRVIACMALVGVAPNSASAAEHDLFADVRELNPVRLVAAVMARNPTLPAMQAAWKVAEARIEQTAALDDPTLSYAMAPGAAQTTALHRGQVVELSQSLPWPGKRRLREEVARNEAKAARDDIDQARLKITAATKRAFVDWYLLHQTIAINHVSQDLWREYQSIALSRYGTGNGAKQDVLRAELESDQLEHQAIVLERQRQEVLARLNTLLNRQPEFPLPPPAALNDPSALPSPAHLRAQVLRARPELAALEAKIKAQQARTDLAELDYYPDFNVSAGYDGRWDEEDQRYTIGVGINIPLNYSRRAAALDEAHAARQQAEWDLTAKTAAIGEEIQRAYARVEESRHALALYREKLLPKAEENVHAARAAYQAGGGDFLALLAAQKNLIDTQIATTQMLANYHRRLALLEYSVGGADQLNAAANTPGEVDHD